MNFIRKWPLKFKLLLLLIGVTITMLSIYATLAIKDFAEDKTAYVFDSSLSQARSAAREIRRELEFNLNKIRYLMDGYQSQTRTFSETTKSLFRSEKSFLEVATFHRSAEGHYHLADRLPLKTTSPLSAQEVADDLVQEALQNEIAIRLLPEKWLWVVAFKFEILPEIHPVVVMATVKQPEFLEIFSYGGLQDSFLIGAKGDIVIRPFNPAYPVSNQALEKAIAETQKNIRSPFGTFAFDDNDQTWLVSASRVGVAGLSIISFVPKRVALEAVFVLAAKSLFFLMFLTFTTLFVAVIGSHRLTASLKMLLEATRKIGRGDFDIKIKQVAQDEVGQLAAGFNQMATEIQRLLDETKEKARMEGELATARTVQSTLFPDPKFSSQNVEIRGFYTPASECSGDWWFHNRVGDKIYMWIGDATGHGVPAAMVTSAARSASSVLEQFPHLSLTEVIGLLNKAIHGAAKGSVNMTFFIGCFDEQTREFSYVNASHEPPYLFRANGEAIKVRDLVPLMDAKGARLGEKPDTQYQQATIKLEPGDWIMFYTDGVTELNNDSGKMWGERKFLNCLVESFNARKGIDSAMADLAQGIEKFRNNAPLNDDVTYFLFNYETKSTDQDISVA